MKNNKDSLRYYSEGNLVEELIEGEKALVWLYSSLWGRLVLWLIARRWLCFLIGKYYKSRLSKAKIAYFVKKHAINTDEFVEPPAGFASFNDFFIRRLQRQARSINASPDIFVAPADSKILVFPKLEKEMQFFVKKLPFNVDTFLGEYDSAPSFYGGSMMVFRLAPYDYHRFHFPLEGRALDPIFIKGGYDSVNPFAYAKGVQPLLANKRVIIPLKTKDFGAVLIVPVGALFVGSVILSFKSDTLVQKGQEAGYFEFGGSTVVLLFEPSRVKMTEIFVEHTNKGFETAVKVGQQVGSRYL